MAKAYLLLIAVLIIIALSVGAYAYTRTSPLINSTPSPYPVSQNNSSIPQSAPTSPPVTQTTQNQIPLTVVSPKDKSEVNSPTITISGKTVANADVFVNDTELKADSSGNFSAPITLDEGENTIIVTVADDSGNSAEQELTVTYTPTGT